MFGEGLGALLSTLVSGSLLAGMGVGRPNSLLPDISGGLGRTLWGAVLDMAGDWTA